MIFLLLFSYVYAWMAHYHHHHSCSCPLPSPGIEYTHPGVWDDDRCRQLPEFGGWWLCALLRHSLFSFLVNIQITTKGKVVIETLLIQDWGRSESVVEWMTPTIQFQVNLVLVSIELDKNQTIKPDPILDSMCRHGYGYDWTGSQFHRLKVYSYEPIVYFVCCFLTRIKPKNGHIYGNWEKLRNGEKALILDHMLEQIESILSHGDLLRLRWFRSFCGDNCFLFHFRTCKIN